MTEVSGLFALEHVVPVVGGRAETFDGRMQSDHGGGHVIAGEVGIEAAVDWASLFQQGLEPQRIGPGAGGRKAAAVGMQGKTTEGINSALGLSPMFMPFSNGVWAFRHFAKRAVMEALKAVNSGWPNILAFRSATGKLSRL